MDRRNTRADERGAAVPGRGPGAPIVEPIVASGGPSGESHARPAKARYRRNLPHIQRDGETYFITFATHERWTLPDHARDEVMAACIFGHQRKFVLHALVVMPDHVHILLTPMLDAGGNTYGLGEILSGIKGASAHAVNRLLNRAGHVWQSEWFDRSLRSYEARRAVAEYICANPTRAGLVDAEDEYAWIWREWIEGAEEDRASI